MKHQRMLIFGYAYSRVRALAGASVVQDRRHCGAVGILVHRVSGDTYRRDVGVCCTCG